MKQGEIPHDFIPENRYRAFFMKTKIVIVLVVFLGLLISLQLISKEYIRFVYIKANINSEEYLFHYDDYAIAPIELDHCSDIISLGYSDNFEKGIKISRKYWKRLNEQKEIVTIIFIEYYHESSFSAGGDDTDCFFLAENETINIPLALNKTDNFYEIDYLGNITNIISNVESRSDNYAEFEYNLQSINESKKIIVAESHSLVRISEKLKLRKTRRFICY